MNPLFTAGSFLLLLFSVNDKQAAIAGDVEIIVLDKRSYSVGIFYVQINHRHLDELIAVEAEEYIHALSIVAFSV